MSENPAARVPFPRTIPELFRQFFGRSGTAHPFIQFCKYAAVGVLATLVNIAVFSVFAWRVFPCITADDFVVNVIRRRIAFLVIGAVQLDGKPADPVVQVRVVLQRFGRYRLEYVEKSLFRLIEIRVVFACRVVEKAVVLRIGKVFYDALKAEKNIVKILLYVLRQIFKLTGMSVKDRADYFVVVS